MSHNYLGTDYLLATSVGTPPFSFLAIWQRDIDDLISYLPDAVVLGTGVIVANY